ncbi:polysaccharide deacetylase family protein [Brevibacillus formosus]|uniref:NodB homology domain-containing protein n=2 Tax=Brevibacillus formosus TaxID=54913 RepID=A0ABQ0T2Z3_9BACL|nr:polysaccharide deacetylase family protein [Brevibacillus formosus]GED56884.1 hypothetical protein BFO01nite_10160 [Brevibacillus formosus]
MKCNTWIIKRFIMAMMTLSSFLFLFNYVVDPFGVFGDTFLRMYPHNKENNPNIYNIQYLDQNHDKYNSYIIGGSQSSSLSPEMLNHFYEGAKFYGIPISSNNIRDYEKTFFYLVRNYHVENVILHIGLSELVQHQDHSSNVKERLHPKVSGDSLGLFYLEFLMLNPKWGLQKLEEWYKKNTRTVEDESTLRSFLVHSSTNTDDLENYLVQNPQFIKPLTNLSTANIDQIVASLKRIKEQCEARGIHLEVVTAPTYYREVDQFGLESLQNYWRRIAQITDFWDFSGYTCVSLDPRYFYNPTNYRKSVGQMMVGYMFGDKDVFIPKNFGHYTTAQNVEEHSKKVFTKPSHLATSVIEEKKIPIITYHHIVTDSKLENASTITLVKFRNDMLELKRNGYQTIFIKDMVDYVESRNELPEKPVAVTFDDGYLSNYQYAYPILKELGMKATVSIIGWSVGKNKYKNTEKSIIPHFSWEQAREMYQSGVFDIQNHTYDLHNTNEKEYPYRRGVLQKTDERSGTYYREFVEDIRKNQYLIENNVGNKVVCFTYPMGEYSFLSEQFLAELGYKVTLSTKKGVNTIKKGQPQTLYAMKRINAGPDLTSKDLVRLLEG